MSTTMIPIAMLQFGPSMYLRSTIKFCDLYNLITPDHPTIERPITVKQTELNLYEVINGHRRVLAAMLSGQHAIKAEIIKTVIN